MALNLQNSLDNLITVALKTRDKLSRGEFNPHKDLDPLQDSFDVCFDAIEITLDEIEDAYAKEFPNLYGERGSF